MRSLFALILIIIIIIIIIVVVVVVVVIIIIIVVIINIFLKRRSFPPRTQKNKTTIKQAQNAVQFPQQYTIF